MDNKIAKLQLGHAVIDNIDFNSAIERVLAMAMSHGCDYVVTPNVDHLVQLEHSDSLRQAYQDSSLVLADGMPLIWASYLLSTPLMGKISGSDLMPKVCAAAALKGIKIFLLGAPSGVAQLAAEKLQQKHPTIEIVGTYSPPYGFEKSHEENEKIIQMLNQSGAQIVFVGLGAPKQEIWMCRNRAKLQAGVLLGIGASIEFIAGTVKRAPRFMQLIGAEWLFRLMQEPRRLALRYLRDIKVIGIFYNTYRNKNIVKNRAQDHTAKENQNKDDTRHNLKMLHEIFALIYGYYIKLYYKIRNPKVRIGRGLKAYTFPLIKGPGRVEIGDDVCICASLGKRPAILTHFKEAKVTIGSSSILGGTRISSCHRVIIGESAILEQAMIMDSDIIPNQNFHIDELWATEYVSDVHIGANVQIRAGSMILSGTTIEDGGIVTTGAIIVAKHAEPKAKIVGNPAKIMAHG